MRKSWLMVGVAVAVLTVGTSVYAATDNGTEWNKVLPIMKQMHPKATDQQLEDMYNTCHKAGGGTSDMMKSNLNNMMNTGASRI